MIKIGTNFEYQGDLFLDGRQGEPQTTDDLLNWSIPIPEGFEVCLDNTWYTYDSTIDPDPTTGYFHKRIDYEYPGSVINYWIKYILSRLNQQPEQQLQFKSFSATPSSTTLEVNSSPISSPMALSLSWTLKKGNNTVEPDNATVNGSSTGVSSDFKSFTTTVTSPVNATGSRSYTVNAWYKDETVSRTHTINYKYKKFWGVFPNPTITEQEVRNNLSSSDGNSTLWADDWKLSVRVFNCGSGTGSNYPYYVIPKTLYDNNISVFTMWVNGLVNSDIHTQILTINNKEYIAIRTNNIQTGQLRIEFKL